MRFYLIIGKPKPALKTAIPIFEERGGFGCLGIIAEMAIQWGDVLKCPPELVLINLDDPHLDTGKIIEKLNTSLGVLPHYIGVTASYEKGYNAFKAGFVDVILEPFDQDNVLRALIKYKNDYSQNPIFCIESYHDFQYLNLYDVVLLKADRYVTEFIMKDGSIINNYKNLKHTHRLLPFNFQRINRSCVINSFYVYRIYSGKHQLYLRHWNQPLRYTKKYSHNIVHIKRMLLTIPRMIFT